MKISNTFIRLSFLVLCVVGFILSGCGSITQRPVSPKIPFDQSEAGEILCFLKNKNDTLNTFKGIGKIKLYDKNKVRGARMVWAGAKPGKLRIQVLDISGQSIESFSSDSEYLYILSSALPKRFYKKRSADTNLKKIISIPVKVGDVIDFLTGRIPIYDHDIATVKKNESQDERVLILKKRRQGVVEKIYLNNDKEVDKIEIFHSGALVYRAIFEKIQNINRYRVPFRLVISNGNDIFVTLDIEKYFANVPVSPSMFVLTPPEE